MCSGFPTRMLTAVLAIALFLTCLASAARAEGPVYAGVEVQFTDLSSGDPYIFAWDFDYDGILALFDSTDQNPSWTYDEPGTYQVFLEACNLHGCGTTFKTVVVLDSPDLIFRDDVESGDTSAWSIVIGGG